MSFQASSAKVHYEPGSWQEMANDIYTGVVVGAAHSIYLVAKWWYTTLIRPILNFFGAGLAGDKLVVSSDGKKTLKVVAVGYGRTGTYSLTLALEELGIPTLHTQHMYEHPQILSMWTDKVFLPSIEAKKTIMGEPDLDLLVSSGYQATADLPMAFYFEQVMEKFPDCKFILTTRENSEVWFRSWDTLTKSITGATHLGSYAFDSVRQIELYLRWLYSVVNKDASYLWKPYPLPDQNKEQAIASYEEHNRRVRAMVPKDRLLEYSVKEGWSPLCDFLEIESCPQTPFPRSNSARSVQVQAVSAQLTPTIVALCVLFGLFTVVFKLATGKTLVSWAHYKSREVVVLFRRVVLGENVDWKGSSSHAYKEA